SFRIISCLFGFALFCLFLPVSCFDALIPSYTRRSRQEHEKENIHDKKNEEALGRQDGRTLLLWFYSRAGVKNRQTRVWRCCWWKKIAWNRLCHATRAGIKLFAFT
ncbi:hypothetical protein GQ607_006159, partial [Colletotrichum asianum]